MCKLWEIALASKPVINVFSERRRGFVLQKYTYIRYSSISNKRPGHLNLAEGLWSGQDTLLHTALDES